MGELRKKNVIPTLNLPNFILNFLRNSVAQMVERGITKRMRSIWHHRRPACPESFRSKPMPVELKEFFPANFMIIGGLILATILMVGEHFYKKLKGSGKLIFPVIKIPDLQIDSPELQDVESRSTNDIDVIGSDDEIN